MNQALMPFNFRIQEEADSDLAEAAAWYESKRAGLGVFFINTVENRLNTILERPLSFPFVDDKIRRCPVTNFPYGIFFIVNGDEIVVLAIMHGKRDARHWRGRLRD